MDKKIVIGSLMWKFLERGGVQVAQLIVSIIIARLLTPAAFGAVALLAIFISLATVFVQSGLGTALIQKKDSDNTDASSVLYYSLFVATILYILLYFCAPFISKFFNLELLTPLLRVLALILFPGAVNSILLSILSKRMEFKKQFIANIIASILSGAIGIVMAYYDYEAWALVGQQLSYQIILCVVFWILLKWYPAIVLNFNRTKALLSYGVKLLGSSLIDMLYHNLESLIIGKMFSPSTLAFCNKGKMFPLVLINNIDGSIQSVMLPTYSAHQEDILKIKQMLRKTISLTTYIVFPVMILLAIVAKPTILILLGEKWLGSVPFLQLFCLISMLFPLQTAMIEAINAIGKSTVTLKLMTWKRSIGVALLFTSVWIWDSPFAVIIAALIIEIAAIIINLPYNKKLFDYSCGEIFKDTFPNLIQSLIMGIGSWIFCLWIKNPAGLLITQLIIGAIIYIGISAILKNANIYYLSNLIKKQLLSSHS